MQTQLPIFSEDVCLITPDLGYQQRDGVMYYFYAGAPIFSHAVSDRGSFRMILSQFYVNGHCQQSDLTRTFGMAPVTMKRWVKQYREQGVESFYPRARVRPQPRVLTREVVGRVEGLLGEGRTLGEAAQVLGIKKDTLQKAVKQGRVRGEKKTIAR
jgi:transposase-like protein